MHQIRLSNYALWGAAVLFCGCAGETGPRTYPVAGIVTQNGSPVAGVTVSFISTGGGPSAVGVTDESGKYHLTTKHKDDGAVPGSYKVTMAKYEGQEPSTTPSSDQVHADYDISNEYPEGYKEEAAAEIEPAKNLLPMKFSDPATSGFTAEVKEAESNSIDFDIQG